jgi:hypothetical protein
MIDWRDDEKLLMQLAMSYPQWINVLDTDDGVDWVINRLMDCESSSEPIQ